MELSIPRLGDALNEVYGNVDFYGGSEGSGIEEGGGKDGNRVQTEGKEEETLGSGRRRKTL